MGTAVWQRIKFIRIDALAIFVHLVHVHTSGRACRLSHMDYWNHWKSLRVRCSCVIALTKSMGLSPMAHTLQLNKLRKGSGSSYVLILHLVGHRRRSSKENMRNQLVSYVCRRVTSPRSSFAHSSILSFWRSACCFSWRCTRYKYPYADCNQADEMSYFNIVSQESTENS